MKLIAVTADYFGRKNLVTIKTLEYFDLIRKNGAIPVFLLPFIDNEEAIDLYIDDLMDF